MDISEQVKSAIIGLNELLFDISRERVQLNNIQVNRETGESDKSALDLPHVDFYIQSGFDYTSRCGRYKLLMTFGDYKKYFEKQDLKGSSDVSMILLAVIEGLKKLKKPCEVLVHSNTVFGISSIYKNGKLREMIPKKAANYTLKENIRQILSENGHILENVADRGAKEYIISFGG